MINLSEKQEINGFWDIYVEDTHYRDMFGVLLYEVGKYPILRIVCKSEHQLVQKIFNREVANPIAVGLTDYGVCYCHEAFFGKITRNNLIAEFEIHVNNAFFVDKENRILGEEYEPQKVESLQDESFTECSFSLLGGDNIIFKSFLLEKKEYLNCSDVEFFSKIRKEYTLVDNEDIVLKFYVGSEHSFSVLGNENINHKIIFYLQFKNKNSINKIIHTVQRIKHTFAFLCKRSVFIKKISLHREVSNDIKEKCHLIFFQKEDIAQNGSIATTLGFEKISSLQESFSSAYNVCNIKNFKLFEALENFDTDEIISSTTKLLNSIDESCDIIVDICNISQENMQIVSNIKSAINFEILADEEKDFIEKTLNFAKNIKLRNKVACIIKHAKEKRYIYLSKDKLKNYVNILLDVRIAVSHGRVVHTYADSQEKIEKLLQARNVIFSSVYALLLEKFGVERKEIMSFLGFYCRLEK